MKYIFATSLLFLWFLDAHGQDGKQIRVIGDSLKAQVFFLAEIHGIGELPAFKIDLVKTIIEKHGVSSVVMEISKSQAYLLNSYFQNGDTSIFRVYNDSIGKNIIMSWKALYSKNNFTVYGIDFERLEFIVVAKSILGQYNCMNTRLFEFLSSLPDDILEMDYDKLGVKKRCEIYKTAGNIFEEEKEIIRNKTSSKYQILQEIFENPVSEREAMKRDQQMLINLNSFYNATRSNFLCIIGADHTNLRRKKSLLCRFNKSLRLHVTVFSMVCKNCYVSSYFGSNIYFPIISNESQKRNKLLSLCYDKYYDNNFYTFVPEDSIFSVSRKLKMGIDVYYVLFKDQMPHVNPRN